jgi:hypothetical protein
MRWFICVFASHPQVNAKLLLPSNSTRPDGSASDVGLSRPAQAGPYPALTGDPHTVNLVYDICQWHGFRLRRGFRPGGMQAADSHAREPAVEL